MSFWRYLLGIGSLGCVVVSLGSGAIAVRHRILDDWQGAPARLAESVIGLALLIGLLEALGLFGLFDLVPVVVASIAVGVALRRGLGEPPRAPVGRHAPVGSRAPVGSGSTPSSSPQRLLPRAIAVAAIAAVAAEWAVPTFRSYDIGIRAVDSLWYHLPWAASFAQTGQIAAPRFTDIEYLTAFYPATSELVHGLGIVLLGRDTLSPALNLVWLGLVLLAAFCVGRPRGMGTATLTGGALAMAVPMMALSQAGSAANDVVGVFFLIAAIGLMMNADGRRAAHLLAGLAAGLAVGVKLSLLVPVLVLGAGAIALAPAGRRAGERGSTARDWAAGLAVGGGFWYLRNLIVVGNPLPWVSFGILPTPHPPLQQHTAFSVLHYLTSGQVWSGVIAPGLANRLGGWWWLVVAAAILGPLVCAARRADRIVRMLGVVALASIVAYLLTPESAAGPAGNPVGFAFNLRYAAPALTVALTILPLAVAHAGERGLTVASIALGLLLTVTIADTQLWPPGYAGVGAAIGVAVAGLAVLAVLRRERSRPPPARSRRASPGEARQARARRAHALAVRRALAAGVAIMVIAGAAAGYAGERHYLSDRYTFIPGSSSLSSLWAFFRGVHDSRVGVVGTFGGFFSYPLDGLDSSNHVQYVARRGRRGSFTAIASCRQWRRTLDAGRYRYVVTTPARDPWQPRALSRSPEADWTGSDRAARLIFVHRAFGQPIAVYELLGRLDPATCG